MTKEEKVLPDGTPNELPGPNSSRDGEAAGPGGERNTSRRSFLWKIWLALGAVGLIEYFWVVTEFLRPRRPRSVDEIDSLVVAGSIDRFKIGSVTAFPQGRFYLARLEDGGFLALHRRCTHLGCTVPWDSEQKRFVCPCHASSFDLRGAVLSPPAPRPLDLFPVRIENGIVKVDTSEAIERRSADDRQVTPA